MALVRARSEVVARRRGRSCLSGRQQYVIWGDGQELLADRHLNGVLPYLEWGINWRVISGRPEDLQIHADSLMREGKGMVPAGAPASGSQRRRRRRRSRGRPARGGSAGCRRIALDCRRHRSIMPCGATIA